MKIIHLPTPTGNHGYSMAVAERRAGLDSTCLVLKYNKFGFKSDISINIRRDPFQIIQLYKLFREVIKKYDVFHFNYGHTILDFPKYHLDLMDYKYYPKNIFITFNGSDVRMLVDKKINPNTPFNTEDKIVHGFSYIQKKKRLKILSQRANHFFVLNPDLMRFVPREKASFLPYIKNVWYEINDMRNDIGKKRILKIVHAPSNRKTKGTDYIIKIIEKIKKKYDIDFILVENLSHEEALKVIFSADLLIDQLQIGWYGGVAVEAMKMGIPVAVYLNDADLVYIPESMRKALKEAIININYLNIEEVISSLIENRNELYSYSRKAFEYVTTFHNPDVIIKSVIEKYQRYMV